MINNIYKGITIILAIVFLLQAITQYSLIPFESVMDYLGIGKGVFEIVMAILYTSLIIVAAGILLSFLNKKKIVKGSTKNTILLNLIVKAFMMFIIFFPTWITFIFFGNLGLFGEEIKMGVRNGKTLADLSGVAFLNFYLFWYFLITTFIKPEIAPSWGVTKEEEEGGYINH